MMHNGGGWTLLGKQVESSGISRWSQSYGYSSVGGRSVYDPDGDDSTTPTAAVTPSSWGCSNAGETTRFTFAVWNAFSDHRPQGRSFWIQYPKAAREGWSACEEQMRPPIPSTEVKALGWGHGGGRHKCEMALCPQLEWAVLDPLIFAVCCRRVSIHVRSVPGHDKLRVHQLHQLLESFGLIAHFT